MQNAADIHAGIHRVADGGEVLAHLDDAPAVVVAAAAVFRDVDRLVLQALEFIVESFWVETAHVKLLVDEFQLLVGEQFGSAVFRAGGDFVARIVVDCPEVEGILEFREGFRFIAGNDELACAERMVKEPVENPVFHCGVRLVALEMRIFRDDCGDGVRGSDGLGGILFDDVVRSAVADHVILAQVERVAARTLHDVDFVDGHPVIDVFFEFRDDEVDVAFEVMQGVAVAESALVPEPRGVASVGNGDEGFDSRFFEQTEQVNVVVNRLLTELALFGFDTGPGNGEAVCLVSERFQQFHIFFIETVAVACLSGVMNEPLRMLGLVAPVDRMNIVSFDLMRCGCASPDEVLGEGYVGVIVNVQHDGSLCLVEFRTIGFSGVG